MDKDRIAGAVKQAKGSVKEAVGKAVGDNRLVAEGKSDKVEGILQTAVGGLKDVVRDATQGVAPHLGSRAWAQNTSWCPSAHSTCKTRKWYFRGTKELLKSLPEFEYSG